MVIVGVDAKKFDFALLQQRGKGVDHAVVIEVIALHIKAGERQNRQAIMPINLHPHFAVEAIAIPGRFFVLHKYGDTIHDQMVLQSNFSKLSMDVAVF